MSVLTVAERLVTPKLTTFKPAWPPGFLPDMTKALPNLKVGI